MMLKTIDYRTIPLLNTLQKGTWGRGTKPMRVKNPDIYVKNQSEGKNSLAQSLRHGQGTIACRSESNFPVTSFKLLTVVHISK